MSDCEKCGWLEAAIVRLDALYSEGGRMRAELAEAKQRADTFEAAAAKALAERDRLKASLEWVAAEKHQAQADAEREKATADRLRAELATVTSDRDQQRGDRQAAEMELEDVRAELATATRRHDECWDLLHLVEEALGDRATGMLPEMPDSIRQLRAELATARSSLQTWEHATRKAANDAGVQLPPERSPNETEY